MINSIYLEKPYLIIPQTTYIQTLTNYYSLHNFSHAKGSKISIHRILLQKEVKYYFKKRLVIGHRTYKSSEEA